MSVGSIFVPAGNPSLLQPVSPPNARQEATWWTWDRTAKEAASKTHRLGNRTLLFCNDLSQKYCATGSTDCKCCGSERQKKEETKHSLAPQRGPGALPTRAKAGSCSYLHALPSSLSPTSLSARLPFLPASRWIYFWCVSLSWPGWAYTCNGPSPRKPFSSLEF